MQNRQAARPGLLKKQFAQHPIITFFVLSFAGTWLCFAPMVLGQEGLGLLPYHLPLPVYISLFLAGTFMGPTLAAFVLTAALEGKAGIRQFTGRFGQWRVGLPWYLSFLVGFPLLYLLAATLWMGTAPWQALFYEGGSLFSVYLPALLIFPALINWGEEAGWRGFAHTRLQRRYGALAASLLVGFLHGVWHLPIFLLVEGPPALGPFDLGEFSLNVISIMLLTIVWTWIFNGAKQSILIASLTHATFNAAQAWTATLLPDQPQPVGHTALVLIALWALLVILLTKGRLGYQVQAQEEA